MCKRICLILVFFYIAVAGFTQQYGNEWIDYNKQYYKIYVSKDGIYHIPYNTIINAGIPVGTFDPRSFKIYYKGEEQYIYVRGENDGLFDTDDYIEFYGERNDGWLDTALFIGANAQANPNYSLFNDSSAYFLTYAGLNSTHRMTVESDVNYSSYTAATWFYKTVREDYTNQYFAGEVGSFGLTDPDYTKGEGWFDDPFTLGGGTTKNLATPNRYATGPVAEIDFTVVGASNYAPINYPNPDHHLRVQFAGETIDTTYKGYGVYRFHRSPPASQIAGTTSFVFSSINDLNSGADRNTIAFIQIKYAHNSSLDNQNIYHLQLLDALTPKTYLNLTSFNATAADSVRFYDLTNHRRIKTVWDGVSIKVLVPNGGEKQCFITSDAQVTTVNNFYSVGTGNKFKNYQTLADNIKADYYILSHNSLLAPAQLYADYRTDTAHIALLIDVDDLWDQYSYGIMKNPLAIKNFMHSAYYTFAQKPEYLFIIGKGYRAGHDGVYPYYRKSTAYWNLTLVPPFGNPPSDVLFTSGILDTLYQPAVATGRLAARNVDHVQDYLDKVIQYELAQQTPQEWMKNVLHFGGGTSTNEQATYAYYLNCYKDSIENIKFGGYVRTFLKTSPDPIQLNQSDYLKTIINNGVTLMTFFGHAAGIGFDQSIDYPSEYSNYGKYPFIVANSCYAGDIFIDGPVSSEEFVLIKDKGTIGYLASVALGIPPALHIYSTAFYDNFGHTNYGLPVGKCIQKTIAEAQYHGGLSELVNKENCLEMIFHGDPAIVLNSFQKPDYMVNSSNVYFDPPIVTTEVDSFYVNVISTNLGMAVNDSFVVQVLRTMPNGITNADYRIMVKATLFKDTISIKMPVDIVNGVGLNKFNVTLDFYSEIDEISELNNSTEITLLINASDIVPIWPYKYAVVPQLPVTLKASTGNAFAPSNNYMFEMDTTDEFNSGIKQQTTISHGGGVVTWTPNFPIMDDSIVYFWRVSPEPHNGGQYNWRESSFQLINGQRGWGQAHFLQFKNDDYEYVKYNRSARKFEFVNNILSLDCQTGVYPNIPWNEEWYKLNSELKYLWAWMSTGGNGIILAVFDPISGQPLKSPSHEFAYEFSTADTNSMILLAGFINNDVPAGYPVLAYSHRNHNAENWTETVYQAFESIGSGNIRFINNNRPYIIFGKKGNAIGTANEVSGASITSVINLEDSIITKWTNGYVLSEIIGPAIEWGSLHWNQRRADVPLCDSVRLSVIGINFSGVTDTLIKGLPPDSADIWNLSTRIDASVWPYLKLVAVMKDDSMHTPSQMVRWHVLYEGAPETALNPSQYYYFYHDTIQEGQEIRFAAATENVSVYNMDSLLIKYWIIDRNRVAHPLGSFRHRQHPAGDVLIDSISASTTGLTGLNSLWIEVNPDNDQLEQYHFNNIGQVYFYVNKDITNPMLDVTFDGIHIMDGDIVSAKPEIQIMLKDENRYLILNEISDTTHFKVWIVPPGASTPQRIWFESGGQEILQFIPATTSENRAHILYRAQFQEDGLYKLLVQAEDKSANESGDNDFEISFEVINKPSITAVMNWPNPFSTATHFVFTLTGSEVPTFFMIQIMTITGKVVKEIRLDELGPVHIGRNITDYAWDGTDMYGDRLANGVYLYRVMTRINENEIEKFETSADKYFTKEFGKMYLIR